MITKFKQFNPEIIFEKISFIIDKLNNWLVMAQDIIASSVDAVGKIIADFSLRDGVYKVLRIASFPWHFLIILAWIRIKRASMVKPLIFDKPGLHIIFGVPGSGKSSLAFELIERIRTGTKMKPSYINYPFEKTRLSEDQTYYFKYHQVYDVREFFNNNIVQKVFNHKMFGSVVIDEAHSVFQPRNNRKSEYNESFLPLIEYTTKIRQYIGHMFALTQMGKMDIQFMMLATTLCEVEIDIGFNYPDWLLKDGRFRFKPLGWRIKQYKIDNFGNFNHKPINKFYIKNKFGDLDYFDTYATRNDYSHVQMDYPTNYEKAKITN